jgi:hypothetical protein
VNNITMDHNWMWKYWADSRQNVETFWKVINIREKMGNFGNGSATISLLRRTIHLTKYFKKITKLFLKPESHLFKSTHALKRPTFVSQHLYRQEHGSWVQVQNSKFTVTRRISKCILLPTNLKVHDIVGQANNRHSAECQPLHNITDVAGSVRVAPPQVIIHL